MAKRQSVIFYLNGERMEVGAEKSAMMLADFLRQDLGLTGSKVVCAEGDCGACTVLKYTPMRAGLGKGHFLPINSCIALVAQMDGSSLVTVDALATPEGGLTAVQKALVDCHGSQCGFCTPGFVMALTGLAEKKRALHHGGAPTKQEAKNALTGNLCRCTGYESILQAAASVPYSQMQVPSQRFFSKSQARELEKICSADLSLKSDDFSFYAPTSLKAATKFLKSHKDTQILGSLTDLGVLHNKRKSRLGHSLSLHLVQELYEIHRDSRRVRVGARVTLEELRLFTRRLIPELSRFLNLFASPQIKNVATLVGNVANASPIADTPPFLLVSRARVEVWGPTGKREIPIEQFFLAYRKTALRPGEFISRLSFEIPARRDKLALYKISERKDLDISTVSAAFRLATRPQKRGVIDEALIAFGGVAATPLRLTETENFLAGKKLSSDLVQDAAQVFSREMRPLGDLRGSSAYRRVLVENLFKKFFRENFSEVLAP